MQAVERKIVGATLGIVLVAFGSACSSDSKSGDTTGGGSGGSGASSGGGAPATAGKGPLPLAGLNNSGFPDDDGVYVGATDDVETALPQLPPLTNVVGQLNDDSTKITFDPVDGAVDYRVYELPADGDISVKDDGHIEIKNGTYRCAGTREAPPVVLDDGEYIKSSAIRTLVSGQVVEGYTRTLEEATLGYVYVGPGEGLVPVYVLGESDGRADVNCFFNRYTASRVKKYTSSKDERDTLLADAARDDGIAFYVPAAATATSKQVYEFTGSVGTDYQVRVYFPEGPEAEKHGEKTPAFFVESEPGPNRVPLMRAFYSNLCGWSHDELAVGNERFNRIYKQGDKGPWWSLLWSGVTKPTTLVVEALDSGCPYPGHLSPQTLPQLTTTFGDMRMIHEPFLSFDDARAKSPSGELFINGHAGPAWIWQAEKLTNDMQPAAPAVPLPKAIARTFLKVEPNPRPAMDFFAGFAPGTTLEAFTDTPCDSPQDCPSSRRQTSENYDVLWSEIDGNPTTHEPLATFGNVNGELWVTYGDAAADTNGKFRLTAKQKATMDATKFLHVTMEVDSYSTSRRYPQILVTDQDAPIQFRLDKGRTIIVQPRAQVAEYNFPVDYQIELCKLRAWDVNNQCPEYDLHHIAGKDGGAPRLAPNLELGELASADQRVKYDAYMSTKRVYLFLEGKPYACVHLPEDAAPSGPVTVTWGDVLYHSAVDATFAYHAAHLQIDTTRHFDNLGFSSGVDEPGWDETRLPCVAPLSL